jgi:ribonuclease Z
VREALSQARRAGAKRVVLTHFSQRYPKFPKIDEHELEGASVAVAFDGLAVGLDLSNDFGGLTRFFKAFFEG